MREWLSRGIEVLVSTRDISTLEGTEQLIAEACALGPVGGVFHLAMVRSQGGAVAPPYLYLSCARTSFRTSFTCFFFVIIRC